MDVELIERGQGAGYNLRNHNMLKAPMRLVDSMDNPISFK